MPIGIGGPESKCGSFASCLLALTRVIHVSTNISMLKWTLRMICHCTNKLPRNQWAHKGNERLRKLGVFGVQYRAQSSCSPVVRWVVRWVVRDSWLPDPVLRKSLWLDKHFGGSFGRPCVFDGVNWADPLEARDLTDAGVCQQIAASNFSLEQIDSVFDNLNCDHR